MVIITDLVSHSQESSTTTKVISFVASSNASQEFLNSFFKKKTSRDANQLKVINYLLLKNSREKYQSARHQIHHHHPWRLEIIN